MSIFKEIFDNDDIVEIRCIHPDRSGGNYPQSFWTTADDLGSLRGEILELNKSGYGIYYGLMARKVMGDTKDDEVLPGRVLWADFDHTTVEAATATIEASCLPEPTMTVNSGHGAHAYWILTEKHSPAIICATVAKISVELDSDPSVKNPSRIFRVPNTTNTKEPVAKCCMVVNTGERFKIEDFQFSPVAKVEHVHPEPKDFPFDKSDDVAVQRAAAYICKIPGSGEGGRTDKAFRVACAIANDFGVSDQDAIQLLYEWDSINNSPPIQHCDTYKEGELERILDNAKKYHKKPAGTKRDERMSVAPKPVAKIPEATNGCSELMQDFQDTASGATEEISFSHFGRIQDLTSLGRRGQLVIVAGPEGEGKSLLTTNICISAWRNGHKFSYLPLEDARKDWQARSLAIMSGEWSPIGYKKEDAKRAMELMKTYGDLVDKMSVGVAENPMKSISLDLSEDVPLISPESVLKWVSEQREKSDIIVVDCLSQIEFAEADAFRGEGKFVKRLEAMAKDRIVILVCHTRRKDGKDRAALPHADDVQGSKMITRRAHAGILLLTHEEQNSEILRAGGMIENREHERTAFIIKARNAGGKNQAVAVTMKSGGVFEEIGVINRR